MCPIPIFPTLHEGLDIQGEQDEIEKVQPWTRLEEDQAGFETTGS